MTRLVRDGAEDATVRVVLAHGAGAGLDSTFLQHFAEGLVARGALVVRFEFPYMERRRQGLRPPPDRLPVLLDTFRAVLGELGEPRRWCIGGKSMGGRIASMVADELGVAGLFCLGYPFHPPKQPDKLRTDHLAELRTPSLIVQGTRDPFGTEAEVASYRLSAAIRLLWLPDGDHSFAARRASGHSTAAHVTTALDAVAAFARDSCASPSRLSPGRSASSSASRGAGARPETGSARDRRSTTSRARRRPSPRS